MLRTIIIDTPFEQKWVLQGRLSGDWASDLRQTWDKSRSEREGRKCAIDLEDVTCVDKQGEQILAEMADEGARLIASRAYMKHLLDSLKQRQ